MGSNTSKTPLFSLEQRKNWIAQIFQNQPQIRVITYEGLTIDCCKKENANFILRGLRSGIDFEYEKGIAAMNKMLYPPIETVFLTCTPKYATFSSTLVRDIFRHKGDISQFVPELVFKTL